jgi:hypothetical protein
MKRLLLSVLALITASCETSQDREQALGGLATVSAMVVAMPGIPFAMAYRAIADQHESKVQRELRARLDPVYEKRIDMIRQRDAVADANHAIETGALALLPTMPHGSIFDGLERAGLFGNKEFAARNDEQVQKSEFLRYLETLTSNDPVQVQNQKYTYFSETYRRFIDARRAYKEPFNKRMYEALKSKGVLIQKG